MVCGYCGRFKDYHLEALAAFQAYKQFYTEQAVPLLTEQQEVESAMQEVEARAALDAEVLCFSTSSMLATVSIQLFEVLCTVASYCLPDPPGVSAECSRGSDLGVACIQVLNKLHGQRFKLEQSLKQLQDSMNLLEKEHAWQNHIDELNIPMQQHQAVVQVGVCMYLLTLYAD